MRPVRADEDPSLRARIVRRVALTYAGGADAADYREGVAVFVKPTGGAMAELSLGTQKFDYKPDAK